MSRDRQPITYGASEPPPTVKEQERREIERVRELERKYRQQADALAAAHAELDRLVVPRGFPPGHPGRLQASGPLTLEQRIRFATCGRLDRAAQPRLLQEWAPEVWSGRRKFERDTLATPGDEVAA